MAVPTLINDLFRADVVSCSMSPQSDAAQVKKVVRGIVDQLAKEFEEYDNQFSAANNSSDPIEQQGDSDVRRPVRARKEPDRLAANVAAPKQPKEKKKKKEGPVVPEVEMAPAPAGLRGILKQNRVGPYPPPRKSSLSATTGKTIIKKYRKVRVNRKLQFKVIPPLPGWRPDRTRMPEDVPDEEEQKRLEEKEKMEAEELVAEEARRKRRKRKSIGQSTVLATLTAHSSVSDDGSMEGEEEPSSTAGGAAYPSSPDVFYEAYMKETSPDSVLATDNEEDYMRHNPVSKCLFPSIKEGSNEDEMIVVGGEVADKDTVLGDKDAVPKRRRSVRIQPPEEDKQKVAEKKDRRRSRMFAATPMKATPVPKESEKPAEKSEKNMRRRSGLVTPLTRKAPVVQRAEKLDKDQKEKECTARIPWNDEPCRSEEEKAPLREASLARRTKKVSDWMTGGPMAAAPATTSAAAEGEGGDGAASEKEARKPTDPKPDKTLRKGRRSTKMLKEEANGDENGVVTYSGAITGGDTDSASTKMNRNEIEEKKERKLHPFFAKIAAPKPETAAMDATVPAEKMRSRRRSMYQPKKPTAVVKKEEKEQKEAEEDEDVIEVVGEVTKPTEEVTRKEEEKEAEDHSFLSANNDTAAAAASFWRSLEIDAAPYTDLVHVGRDDDDAEGESGSDNEVIVKKMRRLSVKLPTLSSYAVPPSMRDKTTPEPVMVAVFDEERKEVEGGRSERAIALVERARDLAATAADADSCWLEAMRPRRVDECIGDKEVLASGKRWLQKWKKRLDAVCEEEEKATKGPKAKKLKKQKIRGGRHSDESEQEDSDSDYELQDDELRLPNPLVLSGPVGCGKTAYVRALSEEVGFSLLESTPDERRAGSNLRAKLIGAVDNHRMSSKPFGGLASFFAPRNGEQKRKEEKEEERPRRLHTLVVIEHVDVIFTEEDKLFWPALAEILATSKIPIVLTCNVVPDELQRVLRAAEEAGGEAMEMSMERGGAGGIREVEEYVEATLTGSTGRAPSSTVISAIVARARGDLRAALYDAHWATAAAATLSKTDLADKTTRRVDEPAVCDMVASQSFAWSDECARRADAFSTRSELSRASEWPARCGMPGDVYARLCRQIDEIDEDQCREATARAERMMEMARSGLVAGSGSRSGMLTRREIAMDWMPILEQIDRREQEKKRVYGRRHQHYFNVIKDLNTGVSIDPLDRIQGACAFFRLPESHHEPQ